MLKATLAVFFCIGLASVAEAVPSGRVVGGYYAEEGQFPHQVSLRRFGGHVCGGSIITQNYVVTAAHCVASPKYLTVRAGSIYRLEGGVIIDVADVIVHEEYGDFLNDIALLLLETPLIYSANIQPIPLATAAVPAGESVIISGWGRVEQGGAVPSILKWNKLTAITRKECNETIHMDSDSLLCLSHKANNGACNGDSGGPAIYKNKLVGIAGFVYSGCGTSFPDGYANVTYHVDWIRKHSDWQY